MILHEPFKIGSRLLPCLEIGSATVSLEHVGYTHDGRDRYRWYVDLADGREFSEYRPLKEELERIGYRLA